MGVPAPGAPSALPRIGRVTLTELREALILGWQDFRRAPSFGLFFSAVYVLGGLALVAFGAGTLAWTLTMSLGFPLIAPFAAVGLYEVSRRIEAGRPLVWSEVLGVVLAERDRQIPWIGAIIVIAFLFWTFFAHMLFALFMGLSTLTNVSTSWEVFLTANGMTMIAVELAVGGAFAFLMFSLTVVSLPLLLEREVDFVTAMLLSLRTVRENLGVMLVWAALIAVLLLAAMVPVFLGLFVALPVLGHATWHLYRRALYDEV
ncbi:DUF2189 domain-containing protein [Tranquillimonas alkanivorans]